MVDAISEKTKRRLLATALATDNLRRASLRPTRCRVAAYHALFSGGERHLTAQSFHEEMLRSGHYFSLATAYNVLQDFVERGLLSIVTCEPRRLYYDTNIEPHYHFYNETTGKLIDIPVETLAIEFLDPLPRDRSYCTVEVTLRFRSQAWR